MKSDQDILIELEHNWDAAFHRHDAAFIDRVLADEFIVTYDNGVRADRTIELELAKTANENIESSTMDEFIVKEFGQHRGGVVHPAPGWTRQGAACAERLSIH